MYYWLIHFELPRTPAWMKCIWHVAFFHEARHSSAVLRDARQHFTLCFGVILNSKNTSKNTNAKNVAWNALERGHSVRVETGRQSHQPPQCGEWTDGAGRGFGCSVQIWVTAEPQGLWLWAYKHLLAHGECAERVRDSEDQLWTVRAQELCCLVPSWPQSSLGWRINIC